MPRYAIGSNVSWPYRTARCSQHTSAMSCSFHVDATDGKARIGTLNLRHGAIDTPAPLIYTRRGGALNMTPDILESLGPAARRLYLDAGQFLSAPSPEILQKHPDKGRGFLSWRDQMLVAAVRDPMLSTFSSWHKTTDRGVKVDLISGALELTLGRYLDIIEALQPDIFASLGDELPHGADSKRVRISVDRTLRWLDACLREHEARGLACPLPMAAIQGAGQEAERRRSAVESAKRSVSGFTLCGFGEDDKAQRMQLLRTVTDHLPDHLPRLLPGMYSPAEALAAVASGIDLFDTSHAASAATQGLALSLRKDPHPHDMPAAPTQMGLVSSQDSQQPQLPPSKRTVHGTSGKAKAMKLAADGVSASASPSVVQPNGGDASSAVQGPTELPGTAPSSAAQDASGPDHTADLTTDDNTLSIPARADSVFAAADVLAAAEGTRSDQEVPPSVQGVPSRPEALPYDGVHMNLHSPAYVRDTRPLVEGCACLACRMHTRAYVHHLLNTQEMLGKVLLEVHNTHQYIHFFAEVRAAIAEGRLQQMQESLDRTAQ